MIETQNKIERNDEFTKSLALPKNLYSKFLSSLHQENDEAQTMANSSRLLELNQMEKDY